MNYLIAYDLDQPGQNYDGIISALEKLGAYRAQYSLWLLAKSPDTAAQIRDYLAQFIDGNDRLLVVAVQNYAAWRNLMVNSQTVQQILAA